MRNLKWTSLLLLSAAACSSDGNVAADLDGAVPANGDAEMLATDGVTVETPLVSLKGSCKATKLREGIPDDLSEPGPWPVGAVTADIDGVITEIWYPAKQGSEAGVEAKTYDIREHLPAADEGKIPDDANPLQHCDCFDALPIDDAAGPYPVISFVHGTAGWRTTNLRNTAHWASRGFVVVASDHPGITLGDMLSDLAGAGSANQEGEARTVLAALDKPAGDIAFLKGLVDTTRIGALGHSAGGGAVSALGDVADVIVPYAGGTSLVGDELKGAMFIMGADDGVAGASTVGFENTMVKPNRFISIARGGHLVGGDLCDLRDPNDSSRDLVTLAEDYGIDGGNIAFSIPGTLRLAFGLLFDGCNVASPDSGEEFISAVDAVQVMNFASTGAFEEVLMCSDEATKQLAKIEDVFGADVDAYQSNL